MGNSEMMDEKISFKAFLSHRYKSPKINLYFFNLISQIANVQFEIDAGSLSTNVTRLERIIRDADIFIGIYPIPSDFGDNPDREQIENACKYFKLEVDIAARMDKPSMFFIDARYGNALNIPNSQHVCLYEAQEILSPGGFPSEGYFETTIKRFFTTAKSKVDINKVSSGRRANHDSIIIYTDSAQRKNAVLDAAFGEQIQDLLDSYLNLDILIKSAPKSITERTHIELERADFVALNITNNGNLAIFLQALGIPQIRLGTHEDTYKFLFGNFRAGYEKDLVVLGEQDEMLAAMRERLLTISAPTNRINTAEEAFNYFNKASLRKEAIFVSYSGKDEDLAQELIVKLKKRFSVVFNYRDKAESITPGQPWIEEIFDSLAKSSFGITLFSESYFESGNCKHELREIMALRDSNKMQVLPIKLYQDPTLELPNFVQDLQYIRYWVYDNQDAVIDAVIEALDKSSE